MGIRVCVGLITLCALLTATLAGMATARASGPPFQAVPFDLTQLTATAADVQTLVPCSRDTIRYETEGPSMQDVARLDGDLPQTHASYRYFAMFNPRDGDWPTGDGLLDDLRIERMSR